MPGRGAAYVLARLERDAEKDPKARGLLARVQAGELSAHAAAVQAGFRRKTVSVPCDVDRAARALTRAFPGDQGRAVIAAWYSALDPTDRQRLRALLAKEAAA